MLGALPVPRVGVAGGVSSRVLCVCPSSSPAELQWLPGCRALPPLVIPPHTEISVLHYPTGCTRLASLALMVETSVSPATWITPLESSLSSRYPREGFSRSRIISL